MTVEKWETATTETKSAHRCTPGKTGKLEDWKTGKTKGTVDYRWMCIDVSVKIGSKFARRPILYHIWAGKSGRTIQKTMEELNKRTNERSNRTKKSWKENRKVWGSNKNIREEMPEDIGRQYKTTIDTDHHREKRNSECSQLQTFSRWNGIVISDKGEIGKTLEKFNTILSSWSLVEVGTRTL